LPGILKASCAPFSRTEVMMILRLRRYETRSSLLSVWYSPERSSPLGLLPFQRYVFAIVYSFLCAR
jgi:hypothetical protein